MTMTARIYKFQKGRKPVQPKAPAQTEKSVAVTRPPKVLLVVGDDNLRELLTETLARAGCEVTHHRLDPRYYPAELLGIFEKGRFDVVIPTNLGIPFVYVPDLVSLTQKFAKGAGILVVSGWIQDDFIADLAKIPRTAFLASPVKLEEFVARVEGLLAMGKDRKGGA